MALAKLSRQVKMVLAAQPQANVHRIGCQCSQECVSRISETEQHRMCVEHMAPCPCECEVCKYHRANPCNVCLKMTFTHRNCTCSTCFQVEGPFFPSEEQEEGERVERDIVEVKKEPNDTGFQEYLQTMEAELGPVAFAPIEEEEDEEEEEEPEDMWGEPPLIPARIEQKSGLFYHCVGDYDKAVANVKCNKRTVRVPDGLWVSRDIFYLRKQTGTIELKIFRDEEEDHLVTLLRFCDTAGVTKFSYQSTSIKELQSDYRKLTKTLHEKCQPPLIGAKEAKKSVLEACGIEKLWEAYQENAEEVVQDAQEVARALKKLKR